MYLYTPLNQLLDTFDPDSFCPRVEVQVQTGPPKHSEPGIATSDRSVASWRAGGARSTDTQLRGRTVTQLGWIENTDICIYIYICMYIHLHVHVYVYIYIYTCIYVCV